MKMTLVAVAFVSGVLALLVLNREWKEEARVRSQMSGWRRITDKELFPTNNPAVPQRIVKTQGAAWEKAEHDAVPILLKYMPDATEDQRNAATHFVYHYRSFRDDWIKQANEIRKHLEDASDPAIPEDMRKELTRVHESEWKLLEMQCKDVTETLDRSAAKFFADHGFTDPNLQSDLHQAAQPLGKEPWEE